MPPEPLTKLEDHLTIGGFNPLFAYGVVQIYLLADSTFKTGAILDPAFHVSLFCSIFTMACASLSSAANKQFVIVNPNTPSGSPVGWLCYFSMFNILVMYLFAGFERFRWWISAYCVFCIGNLIWNLSAVTTASRRPHIIANAIVPLLVGLCFIAWIPFPNWWQDPMFIYFLLASVASVKAWQRIRAKREFRKLYP